MDPEGLFVELARFSDKIQADLFIAFLDETEVEFIVQNRIGAGMMSGLMPENQDPVIIRVREEDETKARELLEEYEKMQAADVPPSEMPPDVCD